MIDEVSDTLGWDRKHGIEVLNGKVSLGRGARKRAQKPPTPRRRSDSSWKSGSAASSRAASC